MTDRLGLVRHLWKILEPVHSCCYFAAETGAESGLLGFPADRRWLTYFAWRSAPLGAAGPRLVTATYYSFSPTLIAENVPECWSVAAPEDVLVARRRAAGKTLRRVLDGQVGMAEIAEAADLVRTAAMNAPLAGRPLAAANADLPWSDDPLLVLWQAATILREHRGDGHIAALASAGLDPVESLVSFAAVGAGPKKVFLTRGWAEAEWEAGADRLVRRGLLRADGTATESGEEIRELVERRTDELAAGAWAALDDATIDRVAQLILPILKAIVSNVRFPKMNTLGDATEKKRSTVGEKSL